MDETVQQLNETTEEIIKSAAPHIQKLLRDLLREERRYSHMAIREQGRFDRLRQIIEREISE
jgi:hypothetical protein